MVGRTRDGKVTVGREMEGREKVGRESCGSWGNCNRGNRLFCLGWSWRSGISGASSITSVTPRISSAPPSTDLPVISTVWEEAIR